MPTPVLVNTRSPIPVQAERMKALENRQSKLERQIATGDRLVDPSDDPAAANRASQLARQDARLAADQNAISRSMSRLSGAETHIQTATEALLRATDLALLAANDSYSAEDRLAMAQEVAILRTQLLESANARDESGRYIFAGSRGAAPAYVLDADGNAVWQGAGVAAGAEAAGFAGVTLPRGPELFGNDADGALHQLQALEAALLEPDADSRKAALADSIAGLGDSRNLLINSRATLGAKMARLDSESERIAETRLNLATEISGVRGVNLIDAFTELSAIEMSLSAAQSVFTNIHQGSLFDRLG